MVAEESLTLPRLPLLLPPAPGRWAALEGRGVGRTGGLVAYLRGGGSGGGGVRVGSTVGFSAAQVKICHRIFLAG